MKKPDVIYLICYFHLVQHITNIYNITNIFPQWYFAMIPNVQEFIFIRSHFFFFIIYRYISYFILLQSNKAWQSKISVIHVYVEVNVVFLTVCMREQGFTFDQTTAFVPIYVYIPQEQLMIADSS